VGEGFETGRVPVKELAHDDPRSKAGLASATIRGGEVSEGETPLMHRAHRQQLATGVRPAKVFLRVERQLAVYRLAHDLP
jgi:hypothetical protein